MSEARPAARVPAALVSVRAPSTMPADRAAPTEPDHAGTDLGPLGPQDVTLLERAWQRRQKLGRARALARFNGLSLIATAVLCLPFAALDASLLWVALALLAVGAAELRGARLLQRLDLRAPRWLGWNQLVLLLLVGLYCALSALQGLAAHGPTLDLARDYPDLAAQMPELRDGLGMGSDSFGHAYRALVVVFYLALFGACALYQGFCARYYFALSAQLQAHLEQTPAWVLRLQRRLLGW